jgi:allophanate hydrolase subunit 2
VLGSRARDVLSGLGTPPLRAGDVLRLLPAPGTAVAGWPDGDVALPAPPGPPSERPSERASGHRSGSGAEHVVRVLPGPRADWLTPAARAVLAAHPWEVTARSNRVGLRLAGPALERAVGVELPSEGTVPGAVQVPPDGRPVVFLADHPVTGGYPVVAVVRDADLDLLAQVRPGERIRLVADGPTLHDPA